jgi:mannose-6-phosphate isomerase-like protein (cupin superfamily)
MHPISSDEANSQHGITTFHNEMPNGEFRFRLKKNDGTAYIRTEAGKQGAWQKSHFHRHVSETYIVEIGWIACASKIDSVRRIEIFKPGDLFTTEPGVIHNVYMSANSVIHTVKHGQAVDEDRTTNSETEAFDKITETLKSETELLLMDSSKTQRDRIRTSQQIYNAEYRHFDDLIWRTPLWATGIFQLAVLGLDGSKQKYVSGLTGIPDAYLASSFLLLTSLVLLALSHVLYRFRIHQRAARTAERRLTPIWKSASTYFNFLVTAEALLLLFLALRSLGLMVSYDAALCLLATVSIASYREWVLRHTP